MKDNKHIKSFNEHRENLNISDVSDSKIRKIIKLMNINGCVEDFGVGIDFDSIGEVVGDIGGIDISKISTTNVYLEDGSVLPITKLKNKHLDRIISIIENL